MEERPRKIGLGRYFLAATLGEGGMATVYRGYDSRLQVWRAVKVLHRQNSGRASVISRFEAEAQTMALLEHPNIVRVYDVGRDAGYAYIVMELVQGGCLSDWLNKHGRMPPRMALGVIRQVGQALSYAHERGVVHRDIKPHNVLLGADEICRVTDFGIAQVVDTNLQLTKTGAVMGTWGFMAPEQRSDAKAVDARADIYSMGATLFTLLTNRMPNDLYRIDVDNSVTDDIEPKLVPLLRRACAYDRAERYESVGAFLEDLGLVLELLEPDPEDTPVLPVFISKIWSAPSPDDYQEWANTGMADITSTVSGTLEMAPDYDLEISVPPTLSGSWDAQKPVDWEHSDDSSFNRLKAIVVVLMGLGVGLIVLALLGILLVWPSVDELTANTQAQEQVVEEVKSPPAIPEPVVGKPEAPVQVAPPPIAPVQPAPPVVSPKVVQPTSPQCVRVQPPTNLRLGERANFSASLCVPDNAKVTLHYRPIGGSDWRSMNMPVRLGKHVAQVELDESFRAGLQYYVTAGEVSRGSERKPLTVAITP